MAHLNNRKTTMQPEDIRLELTCPAFPEQYDAYAPQEHLVGYLRLRHGLFTVEAPDEGGQTVYRATPRGEGAFTDAERPFYLRRAREVLALMLTSEAQRG